MKPLRKRPVVLALFVLFFCLGLSFSKMTAFASERYEDLQLFAKVLNLVQQYYVEEVNVKKLIYGGIKGILRELDPHTNFLPPEIYSEFEAETSGKFGGLGIEITTEKGILTVISPIEDTPAWLAGIKPGDKIVEVDGESTKGLSLVEAAQKMKGKTGTSVVLGIVREGEDTLRNISVKRGEVKIQSVKYTNFDDGFAYIRLTSFIENTFDDLTKAIQSHQKKENKISGLIIDLRRNPGGLLDQAVKISDLFLSTGTIVSTRGRNARDQESLFAKAAGTITDVPLILLIDEYSASASEILAGALQDNKRALILGKRSFGKGSVQSVIKLGDGSGLKLSVARYFTPSGRSIQAEGIMPDVIVESIDPSVIEKATDKKKVRREKDIKGHLLSDAEKKVRTEVPSGWWKKSSEKDSALVTKAASDKDKLIAQDYQLLQAYNYLKAFTVIKK